MKTYAVNENVKLNDVHLYVGTDKPSYSKPRQYQYKATDLNGSTYAFTVTNGNALDKLNFAAHASVTLSTEVPCEE
ncbi:hypothetical protein [Halalkalibacter urbisdiaboli]|uniref:hypothetical protein n=1 Tax=Halalkalibacter urbisdiaboli TaxID=1960589 RepID=UPI000B44535A|nr:hypothetical protein [Halalkalibacter urbisdiaboli]